MFNGEKAVKEDLEKIVKCDKCSHYFDKEDAQIVKTYHGYGSFDAKEHYKSIYCPEHHKEYDLVFYNDSNMQKTYHKLRKDVIGNDYYEEINKGNVCEKCGKKCKSKRGLAIHKGRVHK